MNLLADTGIKAELARAWSESQVDDPINRHEERGYVLCNADGSFCVARWPRGEQSRMTPPPMDVHGCYNGMPVVAAFHTHPNPSVDEGGQRWEQAPSESDRRWHRRNGLRGLVISGALIYEITPDAEVSVVGKRDELL